MQTLTVSVKSSSNAHLKSANGLRAKYDLYDICFDKMIKHVAVRDPRSAKLLNEIYRGTKQIVG